MSSETSTKTDLFIKIAYFTSLAGASILFGFSVTLGKLRKNNLETPEAVLHEEGVALARRALLRGTLYSVGGFSVFAIASYHLFIWKMIGDFKEKSRKNNEQDMEYLKNLFGTSK